MKLKMIYLIRLDGAEVEQRSGPADPQHYENTKDQGIG
jgi:hypothetical protein